MEILLGTYVINTVTLLPNTSLSLVDEFGRPMLDPFMGFADINLHEFTRNPDLPQYDRLETITATSQYAYGNTVDQVVGYTADYVDDTRSSLVYRSYNESNNVYGLYPWTDGDPNYYDPANLFPGAILSVPYYNNTSQGLTYSTKFYYLGFYVLTAKLYRQIEDEPCYLDLSTGYALDARVIPSTPTIIPTVSKVITLKYYAKNTLETIPDLTSFCWMVCECYLNAGSPIQLPINNCVLGTLYCNDNDTLILIKNLPTNTGSYRWGDLLPNAIAGIFSEWRQIHAALYPNAVTALTHIVIHKLAANNNVWGNIDLSNNLDINFDINHPMFVVNSQRAYDWHIKPQSDGSYGNLIMDSPRIIELHSALNASQYLIENSPLHKLDYYIKNSGSGTNVKLDQIHTALNASEYLLETPAVIGTGTEDEPEVIAKHKLDWYISNNTSKVDQIHVALDAGNWGVKVPHPDPTQSPIFHVDNLGWRIQRINEVLGIRVRADGSIDDKREKTTNRRLHVEGTEKNDLQEYNPNCFGSKGMIVRYLPNKFKPEGKDIKTIEGGYRKIKDIPQLLAELHEQANSAMGYQEGTAIEIQVDGKTYRYPNQLALMTEIFVTLKQSVAYSKGAFFSSVVGEQSIKEVMAGLGLRTVDKYLEFKVAGKMVKLYYKGVSASQSIRRKMSAMATSIGTIIGNIT